MSDRNGLRKALKVSVVTGGLISAMALATPAFADDIGTIVNDLQSSNVSVSPSAVNVPGGLSNTYQGSNIAVVFVNESSNLTQDATTILGQTDYNTVIISSNGVFGAASDKGDGVAIATLLNKQGSEALITEASTIKEMSSGTNLITTTETGITPSIDSGFSLGAGIGLGLGVVILIAVGAVVLKKVLGKKDSKGSKNFLPQEYFSNISQKLGKEVSTLRNLIDTHEENDLSSSAERLRTIDKRLSDLFSRLSRKGTQEQVNMAAIKYQDLLKKIIYIMNEDHYIDIANNPELWNNAESRKLNSLECVEAVDKQILDNIKQLNDSQDLEFNITMQALLSDENDMSEIEELLFKNDDSGNYRSFSK